ncbi:MAG: rhomboid family intramembrane serine protease [Lachnoclostridium edouardi]|uniref:rhomboid family intramembrane serine protease n=1 Tax=Lachnoclostridium edouardi TaxID=1926283 RepID=UPI0026DBDC2A|nr:rhomboid family intramembrane serine protease [Lachnoclostridium edouardi]MDO4278432.1 rhomboid family intramembrane serine protease [Lachnoclostridium edouardi]
MKQLYYKKRAYVNITIIVVNVLYFLFLELKGPTEDLDLLKQYGAMYAPIVVGQGEYYRIFTSMFIHIGFSHLLNNMIILFVLGDNLERALGEIKYFIFYFVCGAGANIISMLISIQSNRLTVSAGASGAIFGVIGGLIYAVAVNKGRLEDLSSRQLIMLVICSLYYGFTGTGVDNAAHISGLILGILLAVVFYRKPSRLE